MRTERIALQRLCSVHLVPLTDSPYGEDSREQDFCPACEAEWLQAWKDYPLESDFSQVQMKALDLVKKAR